MWSRRNLTARAAVIGVVALASVGCGPEEPKFHASASYTPASRGKELASPGRSRKPPGKPAPARQSKDQTKVAAEATKAAADATLDDILDDVVGKLDKIAGTSRGDALKAVTKAVEA